MYSLVTEEEGLLGWGRTLQCILVAAILEGERPGNKAMKTTHTQSVELAERVLGLVMKACMDESVEL